MPVNTTAIYGKDLPVLPFCRPVHLLVGMEPKDTTKTKIRKRKDLLLTASKQTMEDLFQSGDSPNSKTGLAQREW